LLFGAVLYGVELLDEFIYGLFGAALPTIKTELALTYTPVGLLFTLPGLIAVGGEPLLLAQCLIFVASGAYVNLSQATLIDRDLQRAEHTMARRAPLLLGGLADSFGLQTAMWLLIIGPVALIWGVR
jgi:hypothetical protein